MGKKKSVLTTEMPSQSKVERPSTELVRIEESVEDFVSQRLPRVSGERLDLRFVYSDKRGNSFYRCNFWKLSSDNGIIETGKIVRSNFIKITKQPGGKVFLDMTLARAAF